jgi:hypothetical protein
MVNIIIAGDRGKDKAPVLEIKVNKCVQATVVDPGIEQKYLVLPVSSVPSSLFCLDHLTASSMFSLTISKNIKTFSIIEAGVSMANVSGAWIC